MLSSISPYFADTRNDHACRQHEARAASTLEDGHHADLRKRTTEVTYALCVVATGVLLLASAV